MEEPTLYDTLELRPNASFEDIQQAFRRLAKKYHPDTNRDDASLSEKFQSIRGAYDILIDAELRTNYNKSIRNALAQKKKASIREKLFTLDTATKIEIILAYSTTRPTFRTSFASSCLNRMAEGMELTEKQLDAIDNVILSFLIDVDVWLDEELRMNALAKFLESEKESSPFSAFSSDHEY